MLMLSVVNAEYSGAASSIAHAIWVRDVGCGLDGATVIEYRHNITNDRWTGILNEDGIPSGEGEYTFASSGLHVSGFIHGQHSSDLAFNGDGVMKWLDGSMYDGKLQRSVFMGFGKFRWADGSEYEGIWKQSKRHGMGTFTSAMCVLDDVSATVLGRACAMTKYVGEWEDDCMHGTGVLEYWGETEPNVVDSFLIQFQETDVPRVERETQLKVIRRFEGRFRYIRLRACSVLAQRT
jgi:hypothetical protein